MKAQFKIFIIVWFSPVLKKQRKEAFFSELGKKPALGDGSAVKVGYLFFIAFLTSCINLSFWGQQGRGEIMKAFIVLIF